MALRFRIEMTKSTPRVAVLRILKNKVGSEELRPLGSFGQRNSPDALREKLTEENALTEDELYEFDNFVGAYLFSKEFFKSEGHELNRIIVKIAPQLQEALFRLWQEATKYNLEFVPEKEMLYCILNKAKEIERKINKLSGKKTNILEKLDINIHEDSTSLVPDNESKKLFQALLGAKLPIEKISAEFQAIAQLTYHKKTHFEPHFFEYYADIANQKLFPKWYYTIAIDLLHKYGIDPLKVIAPHKVAKHWARLRADKMPIDEAKQLFIDTFKPAKKDQVKCLEMISIAYLS